MTRIAFDPVTSADYPLLATWLAQPHVARWWGEPQHELELIAELDDDSYCVGYLARADGDPVAYVQSWQPSAYNTEPWVHELSADTRGIDIFIGPAALIGSGLGPRIIRVFAAMLFAEGASRLIIDPDVANSNAIRAYTKAGFTPYREFRDSNGHIQLMELTREDFAAQ